MEYKEIVVSIVGKVVQRGISIITNPPMSIQPLSIVSGLICLIQDITSPKNNLPTTLEIPVYKRKENWIQCKYRPNTSDTISSEILKLIKLGSAGGVSRWSYQVGPAGRASRSDQLASAGRASR